MYSVSTEMKTEKIKTEGLYYIIFQKKLRNFVICVHLREKNSEI